MRIHLHLSPKFAQAKRTFGIFSVRFVSGKKRIEHFDDRNPRAMLFII